MTESFSQTTDGNGVQNSIQESFQKGDQPSAGSQEGVDTRSPEYQLQVMQQRLADKDEFINTLKTENQETREMYASLNERMQNLSKIEEVLNRQNTQDVSNQDTTDLDKDALVGDVIKTLHQKQAEQKMEENFQAAKAKLSSEFGEHVEEKVNQAASANGMTYDDMVQMARKSPQAFYKLVGIEGNAQRTQTPTPTHGTVTAPQDSGEKDFAYFSRLMRENPKEWRKPETQREFRLLFTNKNKGDS